MKPAAKDVDILITSTNSRKPFLGKRALSEGLHISAMQRDEFDDEALMAAAARPAYSFHREQRDFVGTRPFRTRRF